MDELSAHGPEIGRRNMVIVDDHEDNILVLKHLLERIGYSEIKTFSESENVIDQLNLKEEKVDCFLLDVMMPKLDGVSLARMLRNHDRYKDVAIVFVTAKDMNNTLEDCFKVGGTDFVNKPISLVELRCRLSKVFELQDAQIRLKKQNEELTRCTLTDSLTSLYNRRFLDHRLEEECAKSARYQHDMSFLMMDLDKFKRINDDFGHLVGDRVLKDLADILVEQTRSTDMVARYGGEEFCVLLTGTPLEKARDTAERIRKRVEDARLLPESDEDVTISIGVVAYSPEIQKAHELISLADSALYDAKEQGRNRVVAASAGVKES